MDSSIVVGREGVEAVEGLAADCSLEGRELAVAQQCLAVDSTSSLEGRELTRRGMEAAELVVEGLATESSL